MITFQANEVSILMPAGGILTMTQFLSYMNYPGNFLQGGITASIQAGSFAGSLLTGALLADRLGRRKTILLGSLIFTIGVAISTAANGVTALIAGRVINGLGNGCLAMMVWASKLDLTSRVNSHCFTAIGTPVPKRNRTTKVRHLA